jgi:hypothetical protein
VLTYFRKECISMRVDGRVNWVECVNALYGA